MLALRRKLAEIYSRREKDVHKYDFGHLLVIGGSAKYSGSPAFNALAALRCGTDLVTVVAPRRAADIIAGFSPDLITCPLEGEVLSKKHLKTLHELPDTFTACVIGGGLERKKETLVAVTSFLEETHLPCVIDADAIHAVAQCPEILKDKPFILTPHSNEFYILTGQEAKRELTARKHRVRKIALKLGTTILLKGPVDVVSNGALLETNDTGSPYMTKGGTGDILAGICGSLLARGVNCFDAALCGAYISGAAGKLAAGKFGEGMLASDILKELPKVIKV